MKLWIFDWNFALKGSIETYKHLEWQESYYNRGVFTLMVDDVPQNVKILKEDYFLYMPDKKTAMLIETIKYDSKDNLIIVNGHSTLTILNQRHLYGTYNFVNAEAGIREIFAKNIRGYPNMIQTPSKGYTEGVDTQYSDKILLDIFPKVCSETGLGINMIFDYENKRHIFDVYKGVDRTAEQTNNSPQQFSDDWFTLTDVVITEDKSNFKNVAYVSGVGDGPDRIRTVVGTAQGRDRYELPVDARHLQWDSDPTSENYQTYDQYVKTLGAWGLAKLNEHNKIQNFQAEVDSRDFGNKYYLGDVVTCNSGRYGVQMDARIISFKHQIENNESKIFLTLGEPTITAIGELKLWLS